MLSLSWALCLQAVAEHWLERTFSLQNERWAARIQPLNARHEEALGLIFTDAAVGDPKLAVSHLERAVAIDPHSSRAWLELAGGYDILGEDDRRAEAVRRALVCEPKDTDVQWQAANLFLYTDLDYGLTLLRGVFQNDEHYAQGVMQIAYRASNNNIDKALIAIPPTTSARLQMMHWLIDRNENEAADHVWPTVLLASGPLQAHDAFFYLDSLISRHSPQQAFKAWSELAKRDPVLQGGTPESDLVTNGDFENDLLNGGFGWRYVPSSGITATLDTATFHSGTRSLSFQIDGDNVQDFGFSQFVIVQPGAHYRVSGWVHAEELEAAHGVRLAVTDAYSHSYLLLTDEALGTFPWREIDAELTVPPGTELVKIALARDPANGRIRGKLWLDDVRIERN